MIVSNQDRRQIIDCWQVVEDHVQTVLRLVEADRSCVEILMLALALRRKIREMAGLLLAKHLSYCAAMGIYGEHAAERERVIGELLQLLLCGLRPAEQHVGERLATLLIPILWRRPHVRIRVLCPAELA